jgi:hypothetical protein
MTLGSLVALLSGGGTARPGRPPTALWKARPASPARPRSSCTTVDPAGAAGDRLNLGPTKHLLFGVAAALVIW